MSKVTQLMMMVIFFSACGARSSTASTTPSDLPRGSGGGPPAQTLSYHFDFSQGAQGFSAGLTDYPVNMDDFNFQSGLRPLPADLGMTGTGYVLSSFNRSDDLFMFIKKRLSVSDGIAPDTTYAVRLSVRFASNARSGCFGPGGAPGESVYAKVGANAAEPVPIQVDNEIRLNWDKGNQSTGGRDAVVVGNVANGIPCDRDHPERYVTIERHNDQPIEAVSSSTGDLWILFGTDSGFESETTLYVQSVDVELLGPSKP